MNKSARNFKDKMNMPKMSMPKDMPKYPEKKMPMNMPKKKPAKY